MNDLLVNLYQHPSKRISDIVSKDPSVINLTVGEPLYSPPRELTDTLKALINHPGDTKPFYHSYADSRGVYSLRSAISERYRRLFGLKISPDEQILITHGAAEAIWLSIFTLTNAGDEVMIPDPCYMLYEPIVLSLGRRPIRLPTSSKFFFRMQPEQILRYLTKQTRLLILNSPENPTGTVYDHSSLLDILSVAHQHGFYVMHDEVFDSHVYNGKHIPALSLFPDSDRIIMVNSFSKRFGMTGWRLGWLVASPQIVQQATKAHTYISLSTGTLIQEAASKLLNDPMVDRIVSENATAVRDRGYKFQKELVAIEGFGSPGGLPQGGFYSFVNIDDLHQKKIFESAQTENRSERIARLLLEKCKIAVVPGTAFGPSGEGFIRITFAGSANDLSQTIDRLKKYLKG